MSLSVECGSGQSCAHGAGRLAFALEPLALIDAFQRHPPAGFTSLSLGKGDQAVPAFFTLFDLLTTLDDSPLRQLAYGQPLFSTIMKRRAVFSGTTVCEYTVVPHGSEPHAFAALLLSALKETRAELAVAKDLPLDSPLLSAEENNYALRLKEALLQAGFIRMSGQALAYVPIDFGSLEEYLLRLSKVRRKEFRRKLRSWADVTVDEHRTGDTVFLDDCFVRELYALYENVFEQSKYHFDRLSPAFFRAVLGDGAAGGTLFVYRQNGQIIGWNLLFVCGGNLVDKYVGFAYPQARDTNLYFLSWFHNIQYALDRGLRNYIAGWTDPEVKAALGAKFTLTEHCVYFANPLLRFLLSRLKHRFEPDRQWADGDCRPGAGLRQP